MSYLETMAQNLIAQAKREGKVVTIEQVARKPLAMGNYDSVISIRDARNECDQPFPAQDIDHAAKLYDWCFAGEPYYGEFRVYANKMKDHPRLGNYESQNSPVQTTRVVSAFTQDNRYFVRTLNTLYELVDIHPDWFKEDRLRYYGLVKFEILQR
jgi:hypothetical protein